MARNIGDPTTLANALIAHHGSFWSIERSSERTTVLHEIDRILPDVRNPDVRLMHQLLKITADLEAGDTISATHQISNFKRIANEYRRPDLIWYSQLFDSMLALLAGRFGDITDLAARFRTTGLRAKDANAIHAHATQIAICKFETGNCDEIVPRVRELVEQFPSVAGWRCALAYLLSESERLDESRTEFERLAESEFEDFNDRETDSISLNLLAATATRLHDKNRCELLYNKLYPARKLHTVIAYAVAYFGPVSDRLGQLASIAGDWESSLHHFEEAIRSTIKIGSHPWLAHVQTHYAEALNSRGRPSDDAAIITLRSKALNTANRLKMTHLIKRIERSGKK